MRGKSNPMINRRHFLKLSSSLAASFAMPSLASELSAMAGTEEHIYIANLARQKKKATSLNLLLPQGSEFNVRPVAELFSELVGIEINLKTVPVDDINTRMLLDKRLGKIAWDIALPATFGIPDLAEAGTIYDLSDLKQSLEPTAFCNNQFYQIGDYYQNRFYGYQTDGDVYMMFYNQLVNPARKLDEFASQFGYPYQLPRTWQELDQHLAFFHDPENNVYGGALFRTPNYLVWEFWSRFHATGQLPLNHDLSPNLANDESVEVLEDIIRTMAFLHPNVRKDGLVDNWRTFAPGNIYANIGWGGTQKYFVANQSPVLGHLRYSSLPGGFKDGQYIDGGYFNWGWNYTVSPQTEDPLLAYLFTLFAVAPVPSTLAVSQEGGFFDPFRKEHYQAPKIQEIYTEEFLAAHSASMQTSIPDFYMHGQHLYMGELRRYLTAALDGDITPKAALQAASNSWANTHNKLGLDKQMEQWAFLRSQYPQQFLQRDQAGN